MQSLHFFYILSAFFSVQILSLPLPASETCTCQPISANAFQSRTFDESLAACNKIARAVQQWSDELPEESDFSNLVIDQEILRSAASSKSQPWAAKLLQKDTKHQALNGLDHYGFLQSDSSPGRKVEEQSAPYFLHSSDSFKITCQSPLSSRSHAESMMTGQWFLVSLLIMVILWLCIFELTIDICVR